MSVCLSSVCLSACLSAYLSVCCQDLDKILEQEEEASSQSQTIRKITYKGEVEIEAEKADTIEVITCHVLFIDDVCYL